MSTEAQRARNARKRAKLKAHRSAGATPRPDEDFVWQFGVRGIKNGFPEGSVDYTPGDAEIPEWVITCDHVSVCIVAPLNSDLEDLRSQARERTEMVYGFNEWDSEALLATCYPKRLDA